MTLRQKSAAVLRRVLPAPAYHSLRRLWVPGGATLAQAAGPPAPCSAPGVREIDNLRELDEVLARAEAAFAVSDDEGRRVLDGFRYAPAVDLPADPYSDEYRDAQMRLYAHVSGRLTYEARVNEHSQFDLAAARDRPFPYMTGSAEVVGTQLMKQGLIIRHLALPPGSRVVEFGSGWGNLTLQLAQTGYRVTAVEIEPAFIELLRSRSARLGVTIDVVEQDMLQFDAPAPFDAAAFFESLHHCADHLRMLRSLQRLVAGSGVVVFATEPIADYPMPWGVRFDGLSVWSMRRFGWLELGFDTSYFLRTLLLLGWLPERHALTECANADVVVARRARGVYDVHRLTLPPDEDRTWSHRGADYRLVAERSLLSCARDRHATALALCVSNLGAAPATITARAGVREQCVVLSQGARYETVTVPVDGWNGQVVVGARGADGRAGREPAAVALHSVRLLPPQD